MRALILSSLYGDSTQRGKLRAIAGMGCDVIAAIPGGVAGTDSGVRLAPIPTSGDPSNPSTQRWNRRTLKRLLSEHKPEIVQVEEPPESAAADAVASLCRRAGIPYALFSSESLPRRLGLFERVRASRTLGGASGVIGGNRLAEDLLRAQATKAMSVVLPQTGVALPPPITSRQEPILSVGFVGRLVPERGLDFLVRALGQTFGGWTLSIVGAGPAQETIEALIEKLGLASRIRWLGGVRREALEELWPRLDCLVVPSRDTPTWVERQAPLLIEAMARGIAPIVTPAGALPEIVGPSGIVVREVEDLTTTLQQFVSDRAACRAAGVAARHRVQDQFVDSAVAARTLEFWTTLVEYHQQSRRVS
ncbi:MAG: glycosyltransferase [Gemmatimonadota bacterium]